MNLPTKLTVVRILMTFVLILLLIFPFYMTSFEFPVYDINGVMVNSSYIIAGVLFIIASLTDFLDGYLARKNNQVTDLGKMLDAIADKILVNSVLIVLAYKGFISIYVPVIIVLRDTFVDAIKMQAASKGKVVAAIKTGKIKTATLMVGTVLAFFYNMPFEFWGLDVTSFLLLIGCVMSIVSGIEYYNLNKDLISSKPQVNQVVNNSVNQYNVGQVPPNNNIN